MEYYTDVLKNHYFDFEGRATRKQFWMFTLINFVIAVAIGLINSFMDNNLSILSSLYSLAVLIPSIAIAVRRLHDIRMSGWWLLLALIPVIGWVILLIFYVTPTKK